MATAPRASPSESLARAQGNVSRWQTLSVFTYLGLCLVWLSFGPGFEHEAIGDLAFLPVIALAAFACWQAGERSAPQGRMRWGWRLIALGVVSYGS